MLQYGGLLSRIATELSISKGKTEGELQWKSRIIYSVAGRMAIASLYDAPEFEQVSIVHFKNRIIDIIQSYEAMYPEIQTSFSSDLSEIADELYTVCTDAGLIYHSPNRIVSAS